MIDIEAIAFDSVILVKAGRDLVSGWEAIPSFSFADLFIDSGGFHSIPLQPLTQNQYRTFLLLD